MTGPQIDGRNLDSPHHLPCLATLWLVGLTLALAAAQPGAAAAEEAKLIPVADPPGVERTEQLAKLRRLEASHVQRRELERRVETTETRRTSRGLTLVGNQFWVRDTWLGAYLMGEVRSDLGSTVAFAKIHLTIYGTSGTILEQGYTYITGSTYTLTSIDAETDTCLEPGEVGFFGVFSDYQLSQISRVGYSFEHDSTGLAVPDAEVTLQGMSAVNSGGDVKLVGNLRNSSSVSAVFCKVHAALKSASGQLLDVDMTYVDGSAIGPASGSGLHAGETGPFEMWTFAPYSQYRSSATKTAWDDHGSAPSCPSPDVPTGVHASASSVGAGEAFSIGWNPVATADSYSVQEATTSSFTDATTLSTVSSWIDRAKSPIDNRVYYYRVRANRDCGSSSEWSSFTSVLVRGCVPPDAPSHLTATPQTVGSGQPSAISWGGVADAEHYDLQVGTSSDFSQLDTTLHLHTTSYTLSRTVSARQVYFLRVAAVAECGASSPWSMPVSVVVDPEAGGSRSVVGGVAKAPGAHGTQWMSDLAVVNRSGSDASLVVEFHDGDTGAVATSEDLGIPADATVEWVDVLGSLLGLDGSHTGALVVESDVPLMVGARTYNTTSEGTYGQRMPGVTPSTALQPGESGLIAHLKGGASFRSNVGLTSCSERSCQVSVHVRDANGAVVQLLDRIQLPPYGWHQINNVLPESMPLGYAMVTVHTSGCAVAAYGSVIDSRTGDPVTVPAVALP
jgi:hypothetical protein